MPRLSAQDTLREMSRETPPSCCYICGEDGVTANNLQKRIIKKLTDGDALSYTVFDGQALDLDRMAETCMFCPMFQPYNVIIVRDFDPDTLPAATVDAALELWKNLPERVIVLVVISALQVYEIKRGEPAFLPKHKKIAAFFEKNGILCICEKKNALQLGKQIQERAKRHGCTIGRNEAELLANRCLCDSTLVHTELDKLMACADSGEITLEMLDALTVAQPDADVFRLAKAVTAGNGNEAFSLLQMLTARSEDSKTILGLLAILTSNFTDLYRAKLGLGAAKQQDTIAEEFGYPKNKEFLVRNAMRDCRNMSLPQLRACIHILRETDRACKSSRTAPKLLLEQAIVQMLRAPRTEGGSG